MHAIYHLHIARKYIRYVVLRQFVCTTNSTFGICIYTTRFLFFFYGAVIDKVPNRLGMGGRNKKMFKTRFRVNGVDASRF